MPWLSHYHIALLIAPENLALLYFEVYQYRELHEHLHSNNRTCIALRVRYHTRTITASRVTQVFDSGAQSDAIFSGDKAPIYLQASRDPIYSKNILLKLSLLSYTLQELFRDPSL